MTNNIGFYQQNNQVLKFDVLKDIDLILFDHYIKQKENLQRLKDELPKGQFYLSVRNVSLDLNITFGKAQRIIKKFEDLNIIALVTRGKNKVPSIFKYIVVSDTNIDTKECSNNATSKGASDTKSEFNNYFSKIDTKTDTNGDTKECSNNATSKGVSDTKSDTKSDTSKKEYIKRINKNHIYIEVVEYLNKKINSSYKSTTKVTQKLIDARLEDGFTLENFKIVIDIKANDWLNTERAKYLRPQTLFGDKFESYLNQQMTFDIPKENNYEDMIQI